MQKSKIKNKCRNYKNKFVMKRRGELLGLSQLSLHFPKSLETHPPLRDNTPLTETLAS